jgi:hypothetical protein
MPRAGAMVTSVSCLQRLSNLLPVADPLPFQFVVNPIILDITMAFVCGVLLCKILLWPSSAICSGALYLSWMSSATRMHA